MTPELNEALVFLVQAAVMPIILVSMWLMLKVGTFFAGSKRVVKLSGEVQTAPSDNHYTRSAAKENARAAETTLEAQKIALKIAETQRDIEEIRQKNLALENSAS